MNYPWELDHQWFGFNIIFPLFVWVFFAVVLLIAVRQVLLWLERWSDRQAGLDFSEGRPKPAEGEASHEPNAKDRSE